MRPYVRKKYFNWLAVDMIQRFNTRAGVLKRTRRNSFEQYHFQLLAGAPSLRSLNIVRLPSVLDPIVMKWHSFGLFPKAPRFLPQRIAGSGYEIEYLLAARKLFFVPLRGTTDDVIARKKQKSWHELATKAGKQSSLHDLVKKGNKLFSLVNAKFNTTQNIKTFRPSRRNFRSNMVFKKQFNL